MGIVAEAKTKQSDARALAEGLKACGARGKHMEEGCGRKRDHHRKYQGLLEHRPRGLWIMGPESFGDAPDLVSASRSLAEGSSSSVTRH